MTTNVDEAIRRLQRARREGVPQPALELADIGEAYAVQAGVAATMGWPYRTATHWKSGAAGPGAQHTHAPLPPQAVRSSPARFGDLKLFSPAIEIEIALRLGKSVSAEQAATLTIEQAAALVDGLCVSVEVVDCRWLQGNDAPALAKLADLQSHGGLALGEWLDWPDGKGSGHGWSTHDWCAQRCSVRIGADDWRTFTGSHSLGNPVATLPEWLRHVCGLNGSVASGCVVTTGSWCGMLPAARGDAVHARFEGIGEVSLTL